MTRSATQCTAPPGQARVLVTGVNGPHKLWVGALVGMALTGDPGLPDGIRSLADRADMRMPRAADLFDDLAEFEFLDFGLYRLNPLTGGRRFVGYAVEAMARPGVYVTFTSPAFLPDVVLERCHAVVHLTHNHRDHVAATTQWEKAFDPESAIGARDVRTCFRSWVMQNFALHTRRWPLPVFALSVERLLRNPEAETGRLCHFLGHEAALDTSVWRPDALFGQGWFTALLEGRAEARLPREVLAAFEDRYRDVIEAYYGDGGEPGPDLFDPRPDERVQRHRDTLYPLHRYMGSILRNSFDPTEPHATVIHIPARSGSTRLRDKNIIPLGDKPLLAHTIGHALAIEGVDHVVVDTDSETYAEIARSHGAEVFDLRPESISRETSGIVLALGHVVESLVRRDILVGKIATLYPTNPFRNVRVLESLMRRLEDYSRVVACSTNSVNFDSILVPNGTGLARVRARDAEELSRYWFIKGSGYFTGRNYLCSAITQFYHVLEDPIECIDIDTDQDMRLARSVVVNNLNVFGD